MIKKYLLGLGIVILGFLGFSNAQTVGNLPLSFYQGNTYNIIDTDLNFESIGTDNISYKSLYFSFSDGTKKYIFWSNGKIYFYNSKTSVQGFYDKVCLIPSDNGTREGNYCQDSDYQSISIFYNLQNPNFTNAWVYPEGGIGNLCFYDSNSKYYYCFSVELLTGSLNIPSNSDINYVSQYLGNSIFSGGNNISDIPIGNMTNILCPTVQQLINNYNSKGFYSGLCYSSDRIFNGSSFVTVGSQSIFDLFSSKDDYLTALQGYGTYCESSVYNSSVCADYFSGQELRFNIISKLPNDLDVVGGRKQLYTYCNLYNYDPNATTCVSSGITADLGTEITNQDVLHSLVNGDYSIFSPVTNNSEYDTVFNNGSGYEYSGDIITNIQHLFGKFTSLFRQQTGNTPGILPLWILIPFIIIVLFKLFRK